MSDEHNLPGIALAVRQPWAWAIIHGGKDIENRSEYSVRLGAMDARPISILASLGMKRDEYEKAASFMASIGVSVPAPAYFFFACNKGSRSSAFIARAVPMLLRRRIGFRSSLSHSTFHCWVVLQSTTR